MRGFVAQCSVVLLASLVALKGSLPVSSKFNTLLICYYFYRCYYFHLVSVIRLCSVYVKMAFFDVQFSQDSVHDECYRTQLIVLMINMKLVNECTGDSINPHITLSMMKLKSHLVQGNIDVHCIGTTEKNFECSCCCSFHCILLSL